MYMYIIKSKKKPMANGVFDAFVHLFAPLNCRYNFLKMREMDIFARLTFLQVIVGLHTDVLRIYLLVHIIGIYKGDLRWFSRGCNWIQVSDLCSWWKTWSQVLEILVVWAFGDPWLAYSKPKIHGDNNKNNEGR